jgi:2-polyprenyl-3-methyl-5-hydroxy-6-metoxy-1,4-benzoquinol methylase
MADEEVERILREIRERVRSEPPVTAFNAEPSATGNGGGDGAVAPGLDRGAATTDVALIGSYLTTTERAWDRLPPLVSNRSGALARMELWVKRHAKTAARWFTWEQVNFNAAVHHALRDMVQALSDVDKRVRAVRAEAREESAAQQAKTGALAAEIRAQQAMADGMIAELRTEFEERKTGTNTLRDEVRAESQARQIEAEAQEAKNVALLTEMRSQFEERKAETKILREEMHVESEALRIELELRRIELNTLRAQPKKDPEARPTKPGKLFAQPAVVTDLNECFFYHSMDIPKHGTVEGHWDLRGHESQYLGEVAFAGKRVLEIGPASGHLSFFMEREGAEVVSVDAADEYAWEFFWDIPQLEPTEITKRLASHRDMMRRLKNSYWFAHRAFKSKNRVHYGSAYSIPDELERFDISVIACVLLHNKSPLKILENCARLTNETVIVVEPFRETQLAQSPAEFLPAASENLWHTWWGFSPVYFANILRSMGFAHNRVTFHRQICQGELTDLFTIVASRGQSILAPKEASQIDAELTSVVEHLSIATDELTKVPVSIVNRGEVPLSSSTRPPTVLSYHWRNESGESVVWDGMRTVFPRTLYQGDREDLLLTVRAPAEAGSYLLDISLLKEHVKWYDDGLPSPQLRIKTSVLPR